MAQVPNIVIDVSEPLKPVLRLVGIFGLLNEVAQELLEPKLMNIGDDDLTQRQYHVLGAANYLRSALDA